MKVITQLIRHFWQRGALTVEQAEYLLDQGFARLSDLPGFVPPQPEQRPEPDMALVAPLPLEVATEGLERPRRRAGRGGPKGDVPEAVDLQLWLRRQFARRRAAFAALVRLGERWGPCPTWHEAAIALRQSDSARFAKHLAAALRAREVSLRQLWQALDPEPFYTRMEDSSLRGPTVRAFRILLAVNDAPRLGKYAWILKLSEVQAACNLLQAHRRLVEGLRDMFDHHRPTLNAALQHAAHPVPHWALLLLHNARRPASAAATGAREYGPLEPPADELWRQAWTTALAMDSPAVTRLLLDCYGRQTPGEGSQCARPLYCPLGWKMP